MNLAVFQGRWLGVLTIAAALMVGTSSGKSAEAENLQVATTDREVRVQWKGRTLLVYAFATNQIKPYVRELYTLLGENVLRDAPADHLHHHGLMYAVAVNGTNFWEEMNQPGRQHTVALQAPSIGRTADLQPEASFTQSIHWIAAGNAEMIDTAPAAILIERRKLRLIVDETRREVALHWHADFEVGPACSKVRLHGSAYNGLGLRFAQAWEGTARHLNSDDVSYSAEQKGDVTSARWATVVREGQPHPTTVVLLGHPLNAGETRFFSMRNPFTYLSVTQNLAQCPLEYSRGDRFSLDYLLLLYTETKPREFVEQRYREWTRLVTFARSSPTE